MLALERMLNTKLEVRISSRKSGLRTVSGHSVGDKSACDGQILALFRHQAPGFAGGGGRHGRMGPTVDFR